MEAVEACAARIEGTRAESGAFYALCLDRALFEANGAEARYRQRSARSLEGVPFVAKDNFDSAEVETTYGSQMFLGHIPTRDAVALGSARAAGGILMGKTQLHEFAWGATSINRALGSAVNPWASERISGGSSGGSAVAVALRAVPLALAPTPAAPYASQRRTAA